MISRFLRTSSTRRLLAVLLGLLSAVVVGGAIAIAASTGGPVPPREGLAQAIHQGLAAPKISGITARISFTNHLIDAASLQGSDPILSGATGRLWLSPDQHRLRLELQGDNGDAQVVVDNRSFWVYDPSGNTVYEGTLPAGAAGGSAYAHRAADHGLPSIAEIQRTLNRLAQHVDLSGAIPGDVAGQPTYSVRVSPRHDGGLLGAAELGWDAVRGVPLRIAVYARDDSKPVLELKATDISYGPVPAADFAVSPPQSAKVVKLASLGGHAGQGALAHRLRRDAAHRRARDRKSGAEGIRAVSARLSFRLDAPSSLVGLKRRAVTLLDWKGSPAALVAYGQNLGGIVVLEQRAQPGGAIRPSATGGDGHQGLNLPTVSINGVSGQELDTALGTMVRFTRAGVSYTVLGSVPPVAADQAARAL